MPFNNKALIVNTGLALEYLSKGKFKATNHRVLWNKSTRLSIPFFFEPSFDFKMNKYFLSRFLLSFPNKKKKKKHVVLQTYK